LSVSVFGSANDEFELGADFFEKERGQRFFFLWFVGGGGGSVFLRAILEARISFF